MAHHTMMAFDGDLRELANGIMDLGARAQNQLANALEALLNGNAILASEVRKNDEIIDQLQQEVETKAVETIARRQPLAVDLREIVGALRIAADLERVGDLAANIAKRAEQIAGDRITKDVSVQLRLIGQRVLAQLNAIMESYVQRDLAGAIDVWKNDEEVDALHNSTFRYLLTYMLEDPGNISLGMHLLFCAKNIERVGDHATNIAESVHYILRGSTIPGERPKLNVTNFQALPH